MNIRKLKTALCLLMVVCTAVFAGACVPKQIENIKIKQEKLVLNAGETKKLSVEYTPSGVKSDNLNWITSDSNVAVVSDGEVQAVAKGWADITVVTNNGKRSTCSVKVKDIKIKKINITEDELELRKDEKHRLSADITPTDYTQSVKWKSSDPSIAYVSKDGVVKAEGKGTAIITCKASGKIKDSCLVTVKSKKQKNPTAEKNISREVLENLPFDYEKLNVPEMAKKMKKRYRFNMQFAINKITSGSLNRFCKGTKTVNMVEIPEGEFGWDYKRLYFYSKGKLYFACVSKGEEKHKIYYYKNTMIRYINPDKVVTDFEQGIDCEIGERALKEAKKVN